MDETIRFKKILALIPEELYNELASKKMFNSDWDGFVTHAIRDKLERDSNES